jgi:hypothetical protein
MIGAILSVGKWFFGPIGRWVGIILLALIFLGSFKSCIMKRHFDQVRAKVAEKNLEIKEKDDEDQKKVHEMSDDDLADFLRGDKRVLPGH